MTEAAQVFQQEVKERSSIKKSVNNRKHGSSTQKLGNKPMSWQEIRSKHGEEKTYHLERFMTFEEFCEMPKDLQIEYLNKLQDKYDIGIKHISRELFDRGDDGLQTYLRSICILDECNPDKRRAKSGLQQFKDDILEQERRDEISLMIDQDVKLSRLGRFITYDEYLTMNPQERLDYVNSLVEKYGVSNAMISKHLFEKNDNTLYGYFLSNGLQDQLYKIPKSASRTEEYQQKVRLFIDAAEQWKHPIKYSEKVVNDTIKEMVNVFGTPEIKNELAEIEEKTNNSASFLSSYESEDGLNEDELAGLSLMFNGKKIKVSISIQTI